LQIFSLLAVQADYRNFPLIRKIWLKILIQVNHLDENLKVYLCVNLRLNKLALL